MPETLGAMEQPKTVGFVQTDHVNANSKRIEEGDRELEELMKQHMGGEEEPAKAPKKAPAKTEADDADGEPEPTSAEEKTYKKRYGDLRRHMNELQARIKELEEAQTKSPERLRPPKSDEDIKDWMRRFPDVAAVVETIAEKIAADKVSKVESRFAEIDRLAEEATRNKAEAEIRAYHPDFDELRESDSFHDWAAEQPKWIQDALYENANDPAAVVKVINLYKLENGMDTQSRKKQSREAASAVVTKRTRPEVDSDGGGATWSESRVERLSAADYEKHQDEIMNAIRVGKFIYDKSGGVR